MDRGAYPAMVQGAAKGQTRLSNLAHSRKGLLSSEWGGRWPTGRGPSRSVSEYHTESVQSDDGPWDLRHPTEMWSSSWSRGGL